MFVCCASGRVCTVSTKEDILSIFNRLLGPATAFSCIRCVRLKSGLRWLSFFAFQRS